MSDAKKTGACKTVAKGGVGESGATSLLHHTVTGDKEIVMVLRRAESSLCGNTGAVGVLVVNGTPIAHGVITDRGSSVQTNAKPGDHVLALIHSIPLFNDIVCVRLGELNANLDQCDLV